jgi:hypothetical protein
MAHPAMNLGGLLGAYSGLGAAQSSQMYWSQESARMYAQQAQAVANLNRGFQEVYDVCTDSMKRVYTTFRAQLRAEIEAWLPRIRN